MIKKPLRPIDFDHLGDYLASRRKSLNITQERLAELCEVTPTHISRVESGGGVSLDTVYQMCCHLHASLDDALGLPNSDNTLLYEAVSSLLTLSTEDQFIALYVLKAITLSLTIHDKLKENYPLEEILEGLNPEAEKRLSELYKSLRLDLEKHHKKLFRYPTYHRRTDVFKPGFQQDEESQETPAPSPGKDSTESPDEPDYETPSRIKQGRPRKETQMVAEPPLAYGASASAAKSSQDDQTVPAEGEDSSRPHELRDHVDSYGNPRSHEGDLYAAYRDYETPDDNPYENPYENPFDNAYDDPYEDDGFSSFLSDLTDSENPFD